MSGSLLAATLRLLDRPSLFATEAPRSTVLIRAAVGLAVFVPEGVQKLVFPDVLGAGRFAAIGIPLPAVTGPFVGVIELLCGALIALGWRTRLASVPLIVVMIVALVSTKVPILLGADVWIFRLTEEAGRTGFWAAQHAARTDMAMLLSLLFLSLVGAGPWSIDATIARRHAEQERRGIA